MEVGKRMKFWDVPHGGEFKIYPYKAVSMPKDANRYRKVHREECKMLGLPHILHINKDCKVLYLREVLK